MDNRKLPILMCSVFIAAPACNQKDAEGTNTEERPNILWLSFEDTSASHFGCYGNTGVNTPIADSLAAIGLQYMNTWSVAPQSSPARSSLITGCYATTYGMDIHPVPQETPAGIYFPQLLRDAGYYCTNNNKTHYNSTQDNKGCWDECDKQASYNSPQRKEGQPFFAVFNSVASHMGRIRTFHTEGRRDYAEEGICKETLELPSYLPDLPEVRSDYAGHLESTQDIDKWLGIFLKDLKERGLDENTIIFFFGDNGGCLPRGKGYLYESGLKVPLIMYFPEKWKHLASDKPGKIDNLVNFTDLGPTVLSLAGIRPPEHMQGKALHGKYACKEEKKYQFGFGGNQLHHFMPVRAVTDGRYKMIRSYIPYRQFALRNYYQWGMPANKAWDRYVFENENPDPVYTQPFGPHPAEMLFDLESDPGEINDLSGNPEYAGILAKMRKEMSRHIRSTKDLGFFLPDTRKGRNQYEWVRETGFPLNDMYRLAEAAGLGDIRDLKLFEEALSDDCPDFRFWGVVGYATLARTGAIKECPDALLSLLDDPNPYVAVEAAYAAAYLGHPDKGIERMLIPVKEEDRKVGYSALECLTLDKGMHEHILNYSAEICEAADSLPRVENEDTGWMARGILVNLGLIGIDDLHGPEFHEEGLRLNKGRRKMLPRP